MRSVQCTLQSSDLQDPGDSDDDMGQGPALSCPRPCPRQNSGDSNDDRGQFCFVPDPVQGRIPSPHLAMA